MNDKLANIAKEGGGATTSLVVNMLRGAFDDSMPLDKRMVLLNPLRALRNMQQAYMWWRDEGITAADGSRLVKLDMTDPVDILKVAGKSAGFQPQGVGEKYEELRIKQEYIKFYTMRKEVLTTMLFRSQLRGDVEGKQEALDAIRQYNQDVPIPELRITNLGQAMKQRLKAETLHEQDIGATKIERGIQRKMREGTMP